MPDEAAVARDSGPLGIFRPRREYVLPYWFLLAPCLFAIYISASTKCPGPLSKTTCFELDPLPYVGYALACVVACYPLAIALYAFLPIKEWNAQSGFSRALFTPSRRTVLALLGIAVLFIASLFIEANPNSVPNWLSKVAWGIVVVLAYPGLIPVEMYNALFEPEKFLGTYVAYIFVIFGGVWHMLLAVGVDRLVGVIEGWI